MKPTHHARPPDVLAFAEIKAAVEDFDSGEANWFDALLRIKDALALSTAANRNPEEAA